MNKLCGCGCEMDIRLRTVVYAGKVQIENVPVYSCEQCFQSEVMTEVKPELASLIGRLGHNPDRQRLEFQHMNEWALLISRAVDEQLASLPIHAIVRERIDQLLDMLLLASSVGDKAWETELLDRLTQITKPAPVT